MCIDGIGYVLRVGPFLKNYYVFILTIEDTLKVIVYKYCKTIKVFILLVTYFDTEFAYWKSVIDVKILQQCRMIESCMHGATYI